jgi:hypothetical protein
MMGRWTALAEIEDRLAIKVGKMIGSVGQQGLKRLHKTRQTLRTEIFQSLKSGRTYQPKEPRPKPAPNQNAQENEKLGVITETMALRYGLTKAMRHFLNS